MSLFQIRDIASRRHQSKSLQSFDLQQCTFFLCLSFKFAISRCAVISPNRFNRSIFGILCLSFKFAISRCAVISPNRFNRSIFGILCLSFKFAISRRAVISPNRFNRSICNNARFFYVSLSNSRYRVAPSSVQIASIVRSSVSMYGFLCRLRQCNWVKIQLRVRMG